MTTWINNGQGTQVLGGGDGPTWINNAPAQQSYAQPQQSATPVFDYITRQIPVQQPQQYAYDQSYGSYAPQPQRQTAFNYGMGGVSGNGMISSQDHARIMANLMQAQYDEALRNRNNGTGGMGDWQIKNIMDEMNRYKSEAATGQSTMMFARPQFEVPWQQYNETARLGPGNNVNVEALLPSALRGQNTGERWGGFTATPIGTSFGGGDGGGDAWGTAGPAPMLPAGLREASFTTSQGTPIISTGPGGTITQYAPNSNGSWTSIGNLSGVNATPYNNGDLRSAHDFGSYLNPLLRSGMSAADLSAATGIRDNSGFSDAIRNAGWSDLNPPMVPMMDSRTFRPGMNFDGTPDRSLDPTGFRQQHPSLYGDPVSAGQLDEEARMLQPMTQADLNNQQVTGWEPGASVYPGGFLPWGLDDAFPVQVQSNLKNMSDGFNIIDEGNPMNLLPRNIALSTLKDAAFQLATNKNTWRGDGGFNNIGQMLAQPWANRNMTPLQYGSAMRLFL